MLNMHKILELLNIAFSHVETPCHGEYSNLFVLSNKIVWLLVILKYLSKNMQYHIN